MKTEDAQILTLEEALQEPRKHRNMDIATEPMPNFTKTPGSPNQTPMGFWAAWDLKDRPRRIAFVAVHVFETRRLHQAAMARVVWSARSWAGVR